MPGRAVAGDLADLAVGHSQHGAGRRAVHAVHPQLDGLHGGAPIALPSSWWSRRPGRTRHTGAWVRGSGTKRASGRIPAWTLSFFTADGDALVPTDLACSLWSDDQMHGVALSGAMARSLEHAVAELGRTDLRPARYTVDLFRAARMQPCHLRTDVVREGRRLCLVDAVLEQDGEPVARASGAVPAAERAGARGGVGARRRSSTRRRSSWRPSPTRRGCRCSAASGSAGRRPSGSTRTATAR